MTRTRFHQPKQIVRNGRCPSLEFETGRERIFVPARPAGRSLAKRIRLKWLRRREGADRPPCRSRSGRIT